MHKSFCTFQYLYALVEECASLAVALEVQGAALKEEEENKVLFSGLLQVSKGQAASETQKKNMDLR